MAGRTHTKGRSFGLLGNLMIGVVGSIVGRILFRIIGFAPIHLIGSLISAVVGAVLLLNVLGRLKRSWVACTKEKPPPR